MADNPVNMAATGGRLPLPPGATSFPPRAPQMPPGRVTAAPPQPFAGAPDQLTPPPAEQAAPASAPAPPAEPPERPHQCKHCGWLSTVDPTEPEPGDAQRFREAVFAGEPYSKDLVLFGAARFTVRDLSPAEEQNSQQLTIAEAQTKAISHLEMIERLTELRLGLAVTAAAVGARAYAADEALDPAARHAALREWIKSDTVYRGLRLQYVKFQDTLKVMLNRAGDRSFFEATGSGGGTPVSPPRA